MRFVLTGFGKFLGVDDNPTMHLVEALSTREDVLLSSVLKVAGIDAERFVAEAFASPLVASDGPPVCFLHLGVAARRDCICLERTALNCADFRCPDERGWMPSMEPIRPEDGSHEKRITTQFDVDDLCAKMVAQKFPVAVSEDAGFPLSLFFFPSHFASSNNGAPGEFLCNYLSYISCRRAHQSQRKIYSIFVHVPMFEAVPQDVQIAAIAAVMEEMKKQCQNQ